MRYDKQLFKIYLAGFFDGEGHIGLLISSRDPLHIRLRVCISQNNPKVLLHAKEIYDGYIYKRVYENGREHYFWETSSIKAEKVLDDIYPYVILKKRQLMVAKAFKKLQNSNKGKIRSQHTLNTMIQMKKDISELNRAFNLSGVGSHE